jgi:hypothetical protein
VGQLAYLTDELERCRRSAYRLNDHVMAATLLRLAAKVECDAFSRLAEIEEEQSFARSADDVCVPLRPRLVR